MVAASTKRRANIAVDSNLLSDARSLGLNVSAISEAALAEKVREAKAVTWRQENAEAIAQRKIWIEETGLPLARWQVFKSSSDT